MVSALVRTARRNPRSGKGALGAVGIGGQNSMTDVSRSRSIVEGAEDPAANYSAATASAAEPESSKPSYPSAATSSHFSR